MTTISQALEKGTPAAPCLYDQGWGTHVCNLLELTMLIAESWDTLRWTDDEISPQSTTEHWRRQNLPKRKLFSKKMSKLCFGWQPHRQNLAFKYATASHKNTNVQKSLFWRWDIFWRSDGASHTERHKPESQKFRQAQEETFNQKKSKKNVIRRQIKLSLGGSWYNNNNNR